MLKLIWILSYIRILRNKVTDKAAEQVYNDTFTELIRSEVAAKTALIKEKYKKKKKKKIK